MVQFEILRNENKQENARCINVFGDYYYGVFLCYFRFSFLNVAAFAQSTDDDFAPENWKSRWSAYLEEGLSGADDV